MSLVINTNIASINAQRQLGEVVGADREPVEALGELLGEQDVRGDLRHHEDLGENARTATLNGASEVALPIAASTLTTVCVFLPMVFLSCGDDSGPAEIVAVDALSGDELWRLEPQPVKVL